MIAKAYQLKQVTDRAGAFTGYRLDAIAVEDTRYGFIKDVILVDPAGRAYLSTDLYAELHMTSAGISADQGQPGIRLGRAHFWRLTEDLYRMGLDAMAYPRRSDRERAVAARIEAGLELLMEQGWV